MSSRRQLLGAAGAAAVFSGLSLPAEAAFTPGKEYLVVRPQVPMERTPVIIHDFFAYTCPHCLTFAPVMAEYAASIAQDASVKVIRVPVAWNATYDVFPRTYFAFEALNRMQDLHMPFWEWVIKEEHDWKDAAAMGKDVNQWVISHGVDADLWQRTTTSFSVVAKVRQSFALWQSYGVDSTPSVGVAGRYLTAPHLAGTRRRTIEVLKELVEMAKKA